MRIRFGVTCIICKNRNVFLLFIRDRVFWLLHYNFFIFFTTKCFYIFLPILVESPEANNVSVSTFLTLYNRNNFVYFECFFLFSTYFYIVISPLHRANLIM